jgi:hypothetical protein
MGRLFIRDLISEGYFCSICTCHLASCEDVKSKASLVVGGHGSLAGAYLKKFFGFVDNMVPF